MFTRRTFGSGILASISSLFFREKVGDRPTEIIEHLEPVRKLGSGYFGYCPRAAYFCYGCMQTRLHHFESLKSAEMDNEPKKWHWVCSKCARCLNVDGSDPLCIQLVNEKYPNTIKAS